MTQKNLLQSAGDGTAVPSGYVGEQVSASNPTGVAVGASGSYVTVTSITLQPGIWNIEGRITFAASAFSGTFLAGGISTSSTSMDVLTQLTSIYPSNLSAADLYTPIYSRYVNISIVTTYYLVGRMDYSSQTGAQFKPSQIKATRIA